MVEVAPLTDLRLPLLRRREIAEATVGLTFDCADRPLEFAAGQYLSLIAPAALGLDPPSDQRDFSIASSPGAPETVSIAYRDSDSPVKRWLRDLPIGAPVTFRGPAGAFVLPAGAAENAAPVAMIAGGIGLTPFRSMLLDPAERQRRAGLFCWNGAVERVPFADELDQLTAGAPRTLVSQIGLFDPQSSGSLGPLKVWRDHHPEAYWYVAGPSEMVWNVLAALENLGVSKKRVRTEEFTGYEDRPEV